MKQLINPSLKLNKKKTLCNVGNSILKHFNVTTFHDSYAPLDKELKHTKKHVCLLLLDGCGKVIIERYQKQCPFIYEHIFKEFKSVFPPTTVAATTSLTTGKYPIETGYLGWSEYIKKYDDIINVFLSNSRIKEGVNYEPAVQTDILKVDYLWDLINKANKKEIAAQIRSFEFDDGKSPVNIILNRFFQRTNQLIKEKEFVYSYCTEPDHTMHLKGTKDFAVRDLVADLDNRVKTLVEENPDVLFILIADHGMVDTLHAYTKAHDGFMDSLDFPFFSIEPRFSSFKVKNPKMFIENYEKYYKEYFVMKTKEEILRDHTFGYGTPSQYALDALGDYFLIAKGPYMLNDGLVPQTMVGNHAGCTKDETSIYMMLFNK